MIPATAFAVIARTGGPFYGSWYPVVIAAVHCVTGVICVPRTHRRDIHADAATTRPPHGM